ncbi:MAG: adenylosuccinate synthase [Planctomycetota bacterium]|jgi:adenylosuccinate synthase
MTVSAIVGMQWGDEGKGKVVDALSERADVVVRCQGGANAGHTVVLGTEVYKLHVIPSGILRDGVMSVIGNGVVMDPLGVVTEIVGLKEKGIDVNGRLMISDRAHLVMPYHRVLDGLNESNLGSKKIGTTGRGIGPAYSDKAARTAVRGYDLKGENNFREKISARISQMNKRIEYLGGEQVEEDKAVAELMEARKVLAPLISDTVHYMHEAYAASKSILMEGAQGSQLDIDFGTYPYVTSSNTTGGGFATGSGLPPASIDEMHGIFKAFTTRVGEGPFVSELEGDLGNKLRGTGENQWDEFGTTTGRPRRCGWCDLVVGRFAARVNGVTNLHVTKLDVMSGFDEMKICVAYKLDGKEIDTMPAACEDLARCEPVYETIAGWDGDITEVKEFGDLPENARKYSEMIFKALGISKGTVNVGPRRDQSIAFNA